MKTTEEKLNLLLRERARLEHILIFSYHNPYHPWEPEMREELKRLPLKLDKLDREILILKLVSVAVAPLPLPAGIAATLTAVSFAGKVGGLGATGITSGLAGIGLGMGMATGIGVGVAIGIGAAYVVKKATPYIVPL